MIGKTLVLLSIFIGLLDSCLGASLRVEPGILQSCPLTVQGAECPGVQTKGKLLSATYNGTCMGPVIILKKGTEVSVDFHFHPDVDETKLTSKVSAKLNSFTPWIPFPLGNPDACKSSGLTCPLKHNVDVDFAPVLEVKTMYPSLDSIFIKWALVDGSGATVFCLTIPARIVA